MMSQNFSFAFSSLVKTNQLWGGMTNTGMKQNKNSIGDAENYLKYLDGTAYTHIPSIQYDFNDQDGPNPFRIKEESNGDLELSDKKPGDKLKVLCQHDCQGKVAVKYQSFLPSAKP